MSRPPARTHARLLPSLARFPFARKARSQGLSSFLFLGRRHTDTPSFFFVGRRHTKYCLLFVSSAHGCLAMARTHTRKLSSPFSPSLVSSFVVFGILVWPPYQGKGHGRHLLESVNSVALAENVYDLTVEEPSEYLQYLRSCIDTLRLLDFEPIKPAIQSVASSVRTDSISKKSCKSLAGPPTYAIEIVRQKLKINKTQFLRCWDILIYLNLDSMNRMIMDNFRASISARVRSDIFDKDAESKGKHLVGVPNDYDHDMTFVVYCSHGGDESDSLDGRLDGDQADQEQQLNKLVDNKIEDIVEIAEKVSLLRSS